MNCCPILNPFTPTYNCNCGELTTQDVAPVNAGVVTSNGSNILSINPAGTLAALTVVFPSTPVNGQIFNINCNQQITSMTYSGGTIQGYTSAFTFYIGVTRYVYDLAKNLWLLN